MAELPETVSLHEAAERLGVHYMTAYRYVRLGVLPAEKLGATWRVSVADIEAFGDPAAGGGVKGSGRRRPAPWADRLQHRLRAGDEMGAWAVVEGALAAGSEPKEVYLDLFTPALEGIGDAWATGEIDVAVEHRASVIAMRLLGRLGPRFARRGRSRGEVVLGGPPGERHGLPTAMLADLVRGAGFTAVDLGADVPTSSFVLAATNATRLVAVSLSVTTPHNEAAVRDTIAALHEAVPGVPVLIGGGAVPDEAAAVELGADGWAADGKGALELLERRPG